MEPKLDDVNELLISLIEEAVFVVYPAGPTS